MDTETDIGGGHRETDTGVGGLTHGDMGGGGGGGTGRNQCRSSQRWGITSARSLLMTALVSHTGQSHSQWLTPQSAVMTSISLLSFLFGKLTKAKAGVGVAERGGGVEPSSSTQPGRRLRFVIQPRANEGTAFRYPRSDCTERYLWSQQRGSDGKLSEVCFTLHGHTILGARDLA